MFTVVLVRYLYFLADIAYKGDYNGSSIGWRYLSGFVVALARGEFAFLVKN